jgi:type IV secretion system protein VirB5
MGNLVNNPAARQYLPSDYSTILTQGVGQWQAIYNAAQKFDISNSSLSGSSDVAQAFQAVAKQAAINRAGAELAYSTASQRFLDIQVLLDKVNNAPDAKDMADLQGRIQAEQVMMQNEANKLQMLQQLASAQRDLQNQQAREISLKALSGSPPHF